VSLTSDLTQPNNTSDTFDITKQTLHKLRIYLQYGYSSQAITNKNIVKNLISTMRKFSSLLSQGAMFEG
jgi:hypothetical protein